MEKRWTHAETEILAKVISGEQELMCAVEELGRSKTSCEHKMARMKLSRGKWKDVFEYGEIKDSEWAYIAGILDSSGYIGPMREGGAAICVYHPNLSLLKTLEQKLGGYVKDVEGKTRRVWALRRMRNVLFVLESTVPHLAVKKGLAEKTIRELNKMFSEKC